MRELPIEIEQHPVALRLVDLPVVRAVQKLEAAVGGDRRLPIHAYTAELSGQRADGSAYKVVVKGDDRHGLPYGSDGDIFFALFRMADELPEHERLHLFETGEFRDPSVGRIARAMGKPVNVAITRRIRGASLTLSHVRIAAQLTHGVEAVGGALLAGGLVAYLQVPDGTPVPRLR